MSLKIKQVDYRNFRNYDFYSLNHLNDLTVLIGRNAIGKTNLIEGIQLTTALQSFRKSKNNHLVKVGKTDSFVETKIESDSRKLEIKLVLNESKKEYFLNGKKKQARYIRGILPSVVFCPDDLTFIKGTQSVKRAELDDLGSQLSSNYHAVRKDYEKIIKQKNKYLKEVVSHEYLLSINEVLATIGAQLYALRFTLVEELIPYIQTYYHELSGGSEEILIEYIPSWLKNKVNKETYQALNKFTKEQAREEIIKAMDRYYIQEHDRHISLFGPHNDQIEFFINGKNASLFASQGQQRSLVLSYKIAEVSLIKDILNQSPVLLLDDVMSELDDFRRKQLLALIKKDVQTFITSTHLAYFDKTLIDRADIRFLQD